MTVDPIRIALRAGLAPAMRARDRVATTAIRSALAAIDNAEAVPVQAPAPTTTGDGPIAGARIGLGSGEADRRELTEHDIAHLLESEISGRLGAAAELEQAGRPDHGERLRAEAAVLQSFVRP